MYSLRLRCHPDDVDLLSAELWEQGTAGIRELNESAAITLIAGFETNEARTALLDRFAGYAPEWYAEDSTDWVAVSRNAWPPREVGQRFFLAPYWAEDPTPDGRVRVIHNPGLACGTGEHPCTQLALMALERCTPANKTVVDIGTGSGLLAIAALKLGAARAVGADVDEQAIGAASENFELNSLRPELVCASADALADSSADVTVANINGSVLLFIWEDLLRVTRQPGTLIVTGFQQSEAQRFVELLPGSHLQQGDDWCCLSAQLS
jgi:ribosomal protein L11 methyltransferase